MGLAVFSAIMAAHSIGTDPRTRTLAGHSVQSLFYERQPTIVFQNEECEEVEHMSIPDHIGTV